MGLVVLVDTREQYPFDFGGLPCLRKALKFGDYTLRGMEGLVRIERKRSLREIAGNMVGDSRRRYEEIYRAMGTVRWPFLVLEEDLTGLGHPFLRGERGQAVLRYLTHLELEWGIRVRMFRQRDQAQKWTRYLLENCWRLGGQRGLGRQSTRSSSPRLPPLNA